MTTKKLYLWALPAAALALSGCGGGNDNGPNTAPTPNATASATPNATGTPQANPTLTPAPMLTPAPTATPIPTQPAFNQGVFSNVSSDSNVATSKFVIGSSGKYYNRANLTGFFFGSTAPTKPGATNRSIALRGNFSPANVGRPFPLSTARGGDKYNASFDSSKGGVYVQWRAVSGTVIVDSIRQSGESNTVNFRLINARFVPADTPASTMNRATGSFTFDIKGSI